MPGYKEFMRAGLGRFAPDQLDMIQGLFAEKQIDDKFIVVPIVENYLTISKNEL